MKLDFFCPKCDHHVQVDVDDMGMGAGVEAWCATRHPRPVRMEQVEDDD